VTLVHSLDIPKQGGLLGWVLKESESDSESCVCNSDSNLSFATDSIQIAIHSTQWYNPEYAELTESYPAYAAGGAYILSRDLVEWLGRAPIPFKVWKGGPEDAQIGTWLAGLDIERYSLT